MENPYSSMNALEKFRNVMGVFVKQKVDYLSCLPCDRAAKYKIFACDESGEMKKQLILFQAKEDSTCMCKLCCYAAVRQFKLQLHHESLDGQGNHEQSAFVCERNYTFTFLCFNRPLMNLYLTEQGQKVYLGKVVQPFQCCNLTVDIYGVDDTIRYKITGSCIQCGLCFPKCGCGPCKTVTFQVLDANGQNIGKMVKTNPGCLAACITDADNFSIVYPQDSTPEDRALLTSSLIFLDFMYFQEQPQNEA